MKKFNDLKNIVKRCEKKSYSTPNLKEIGTISKRTQGSGDYAKDNGNLNGNATGGLGGPLGS